MVVRFQDGTTRQFRRSQPWTFTSGDQVRVVNDQVVPLGQ